MSDVTVTEFAEVLKVPVDRLLVQLDEAGIQVSGAEDTITDDAKLELLTHLRRSHGRKDPAASAPRKITLQRKSQSELRLAGGPGRTRTVNVEVRRKRTYVKRDVLEEDARKQQEELDAQREEEQRRVEELERAEAERVAAEEKRKEEEAAAATEAEQQRLAEEESARLAEQEEARKKADEVRQAAEQVKKAEPPPQDQPKAAPAPGRRRKEERSADHTLHVAKGASARRRKKRPRRRPVQVNVDSQHGFERPTEPVIRDVEIPETITVSDLAAAHGDQVQRSHQSPDEHGNDGHDQPDDRPGYGHTDRRGARAHGETAARRPRSRTQLLIKRGASRRRRSVASPVVTIMGHVDHGKTSLLDYIRARRSRRRGRRHHPAYRRLPGDDGQGPITFLDTPGPRGVHRHARARRQGDRHRRSGRRGRRRRHAANHRGDPARQGGRRSARRRGQQDRQGEMPIRTASKQNCPQQSDSRGLGW